MSIDPLTEKYLDWVPYVFSGNRVVDSRELEGLVPEKSTHGNVVNATIRLKPSNNTVNSRITEQQFQNDLNNGKIQSEKDFSGDAGNGVILKLSVIYDENATNTLNMEDMIVNPDSKNCGKTMERFSCAWFHK